MDDNRSNLTIYASTDAGQTFDTYAIVYQGRKRGREGERERGREGEGERGRGGEGEKDEKNIFFTDCEQGLRHTQHCFKAPTGQ